MHIVNHIWSFSLPYDIWPWVADSGAVRLRGLLFMVWWGGGGGSNNLCSRSNWFFFVIILPGYQDAIYEICNCMIVLSSVVIKLLELIEAQYDDNALFCDDCMYIYIYIYIYIYAEAVEYWCCHALQVATSQICVYHNWYFINLYFT